MRIVERKRKVWLLSSISIWPKYLQTTSSEGRKFSKFWRKNISSIDRFCHHKTFERKM